ncbi:MAG TPA: ABC transporter permease [Verrucomicrobiae bacterium]|nr:ABC transporter permease [Verrucomicrobiae bacterium]
MKGITAARPVLGKYAQEVLLGGTLIALVIVFSVFGPGFLSQINITGIGQSATETGLLAIAETYVIVTGGIDLSVGAILGLAGVVGAKVMALRFGGGVDLAIAAGIVAALLTGAAAGLANGLMVVKTRLTPFVATLAMLGIAGGLTLVLTDGLTVGGTPGVVATLGNQVYLGYLTIPIIITIVAFMIGAMYLHYSRFGRWAFAIGANRNAASEVGIPVGRHLIKVYVLAGTISALAGVIDLMRLGTASPLSGENSELTAIAAVVIGGASLFGGVATMTGTVLGTLLLSVVLSGLVLTGLQPFWETVVTGALIAGTVAIQQLLRSGR